MHAPSRRAQANYLLLLIILAAAQLGVLSVRHSVTQEAFLPALDAKAVPLALAGWRGKEFELDKESLKILQPEAYLDRDYQDKAGNIINLTLIYGRSKSNIHSPAFCFLGGGWNIIVEDELVLDKGKGGIDKLEMNRLVLQKADRKVVVLYSFLSPGKSTSSWAAFQAGFLLTRLSGKTPSGALLRLVVPFQENPQDSEHTAARFLQDYYPEICKAFKL